MDCTTFLHSSDLIRDHLESRVTSLHSVMRNHVSFDAVIAKGGPPQSTNGGAEFTMRSHTLWHRHTKKAYKGSTEANGTKKGSTIRHRIDRQAQAGIQRPSSSCLGPFLIFRPQLCDGFDSRVSYSSAYECRRPVCRPEMEIRQADKDYSYRRYYRLRYGYWWPSSGLLGS
jgi:hypothetical protein